jgi:hypothetical protein
LLPSSIGFAHQATDWRHPPEPASASTAREPVRALLSIPRLPAQIPHPSAPLRRKRQNRWFAHLYCPITIERPARSGAGSVLWQGSRWRRLSSSP